MILRPQQIFIFLYYIAVIVSSSGTSFAKSRNEEKGLSSMIDSNLKLGLAPLRFPAGRLRRNLRKKRQTSEGDSNIQHQHESDLSKPDPDPIIHQSEEDSNIHHKHESGLSKPDPIIHQTEVDSKRHHDSVLTEPDPIHHQDSDSSSFSNSNGLTENGNDGVAENMHEPEIKKHAKNLHELKNNPMIDTLMKESSGLAKELTMIFEILAKRESELINEMEQLRDSLTSAVASLKQSKVEQEFFGSSRLRREDLGSNSGYPYKACVYIEEQNPGARDVGGVAIEDEKKDPLIVRAFLPETPNEDNVVPIPEPVHHHVREPYSVSSLQNATSSGNGNDIDLSKVFWLKLPSKMDDSSVHQKVGAVLSQVTGEGKDVLVIPVSRGFTTSEEVVSEVIKSLGSAPATGADSSIRTRRARNIRERMHLKKVYVS